MAVSKPTISLPSDLLEEAKVRATRMKYESFSAYLQALVRIDLRDRPPHQELSVREESPEYGAKKQEPKREDATPPAQRQKRAGEK